MGESSQPAPFPRADDGEAPSCDDGRALPVRAGQVRVTPAMPAAAVPALRRQAMPTVHAAAVAAGSFVAGAAVVGLVHRRQRRAAALVKRGRAGRRVGHGRARGAGRAVELVEIVGSRSLLVDVHLLGGSGER